MIQVIRDLVSVSESTNWSHKSGPVAKYHALRCQMCPIDPVSKEYSDIKDHIMSSLTKYDHRYTVYIMCVCLFTE